MPARSIWSGSVSFGLVNIPIKLYTAVRDSTVHFHLLHAKDMSRLQRKLVCAAEGKEVPKEEIVRGFEVAPDQYVVVDDKELEDLAPKSTRTIEIRDFVDLGGIDPLYYDRPYYLLPQPGAAKSYRLLAEAMDRTKKVGIARFVLHEKEHLCALRTKGRLICLETMHFGHEVVDAAPFAPGGAGAAEREMKTAAQLIDSMTEPFDPGRYRDEWRDCVRKVLQKKAEGDEVVTSEAEAAAEKPKSARAVDLMAALEASLAKARSAGGRGAGESNGNGNGHGHADRKAHANGNGNGHAQGNGHGAKPRGGGRAAPARRAGRRRARS